MSKRAGEFSAQDLLNEVEKDQIRFMMLNRSNDVELDFDFDKVKEKTKIISFLRTIRKRKNKVYFEHIEH